VGDDDGVLVGLDVGAVDGAPEGEDVGDAEGPADGLADGRTDNVGAAELVGLADGDCDEVGLSVGLSVGERVGEATTPLFAEAFFSIPSLRNRKYPITPVTMPIARQIPNPMQRIFFRSLVRLIGESSTTSESSDISLLSRVPSILFGNNSFPFSRSFSSLLRTCVVSGVVLFPSFSARRVRFRSGDDRRVVGASNTTGCDGGDRSLGEASETSTKGLLWMEVMEAGVVAAFFSLVFIDSILCVGEKRSWDCCGFLAALVI
jgi:hypothetical protein